MTALTRADPYEMTACGHAEGLSPRPAAVSARELRASTDGTKWTKEQLMLHMLFGCLLVHNLLILVRPSSGCLDASPRLSRDAQFPH
jgi:hypothetical protein